MTKAGAPRNSKSSSASSPKLLRLGEAATNEPFRARRLEPRAAGPPALKRLPGFRRGDAAKRHHHQREIRPLRHLHLSACLPTRTGDHAHWTLRVQGRERAGRSPGGSGSASWRAMRPRATPRPETMDDSSLRPVDDGAQGVSISRRSFEITLSVCSRGLNLGRETAPAQTWRPRA